MTKLKILALMVGMVLLFAIPATVSAQRLPPNIFVGTASIDGAAAADGTVVSALVDDAEAATATVSGGDGSYVLEVDQGADLSYAGKTVSFQVAGNSAAETATWVQGEGTLLDLTATGGAPAADVETPAPEAAPEVPAASAGADGPKGDTGATGAKGDKGDAGATGSAGADGDAGPAGSAGATGAAGAAGPAGDAGSGALGIVALILAIVAIVGAGGAFMFGRRS